MSFVIFWVVTLRSYAGDYQRLGGMYRLYLHAHFGSKDGGDTFLRNTCNCLQDYTVPQTIRPQSTAQGADVLV
jgi:hypothetical protein